MEIFAIVIAEARFRLDAGQDRNYPSMRPLFLEHGHLLLERQEFKDQIGVGAADGPYRMYPERDENDK